MYTVKSFRYTQEQGWVADIHHDGAVIGTGMKLADITKQDCHNFDDVCEAIKDIPLVAQFGTVLDIQGYKALDRTSVSWERMKAEHWIAESIAKSHLDRHAAWWYELEAMQASRSYDPTMAVLVAYVQDEDRPKPQYKKTVRKTTERRPLYEKR